MLLEKLKEIELKREKIVSFTGNGGNDYIWMRERKVSCNTIFVVVVYLDSQN
jgi:hypothetical protein